jgi:hypothetical protein
MASSEPTFIFIPDISGFSEFVNKTAIEHSKHIISELLELIIDSDKLGLSVSEIEGDAVLFYKNKTPDVKEIIKQCQNTFLNFHNYLERYRTERICRCGACETAADLTIKFIAVAGKVEKIKVKNHVKLHGPDVIKAHRLLKNPIKDKEYILFTDNLLNKISDEELKMIADWVQLNDGSCSYEQQDTINYGYIPLHPLYSEIQPAKKINIPILNPGSIKAESKIKCGLDELYDLFINLDRRKEWNKDLGEVIKEEDNIKYKSGSVHTCVVNKNRLNVEALGMVEEEDKVIYMERIDNFKIFHEIINIYTFEKHNDHTLVKLDMEFKIKSPLMKLLRPIIKAKLLKQSLHTMNILKEYSENLQKKPV